LSEELLPVVIGHFDGHGVCATAAISRALGRVDVYSNFPDTGPEQLISTLQNRYVASPRKLRMYIVDIPVNVKDPVPFVQGLENIAHTHEVIYIDHHESSLKYIQNFSRVKVQFVGTSAYEMVRPFINSEDNDLAIIGAICDRDPIVIQKGLWNEELQTIADGIDVLVRQSAYRTALGLRDTKEATFETARREAKMIPAAELDRIIGSVAVARGTLPEAWSLKALEKLAFRENTWYAVGYTFVQRFGVYAVRAIIRWDIDAKMNLPKPGEIASQLWPTRNIIGHPSAPSISATNEAEAQEMALQLARTLADAVLPTISPKVQTFINEYSVGQVLAEILMNIQRLAEQQTKMYQEYLELKRRQVELLERMDSQRARAD